jgi:hypothetical protein
MNWNWLQASWMVHIWYGLAMIASVFIGAIVGKRTAFKEINMDYLWAGVAILALIAFVVCSYFIIIMN